MLRAQAELIRPILPGLDLRGMFSYRAKDAVDESAASYDSRLGELSAEGAVGSRGRIDLTVRLEDREYEHPEIGIPSSRTAGLEGRFERSIGSRLRPYVDQRWEREDYRGGDSASAFVDYWRWEGQAGTDITLGASNDPVLGIALGPDWRLRAGARGEVLRTSSPSADSLSILADYDSFGGLLGLAKEGAERFWFDATVEVGRRDYHGSASGSLVFEGLNLSLASSDFTYLRTTLLAQWAPIPWVRGEAFIQWDEEFHERSIDDFRLWILNVSLTHPF
ncbi:MAG: hypothetical protein QUU85_17460 [Candidatus Eisenbacteria bacterium]|nr:hypothetical protein [Candidatus Eisenbacteria bacterium]